MLLLDQKLKENHDIYVDIFRGHDVCRPQIDFRYRSVGGNHHPNLQHSESLVVPVISNYSRK